MSYSWGKNYERSLSKDNSRIIKYKCFCGSRRRRLRGKNKAFSSETKVTFSAAIRRLASSTRNARRSSGLPYHTCFSYFFFFFSDEPEAPASASAAGAFFPHSIFTLRAYGASCSHNPNTFPDFDSPSGCAMPPAHPTFNSSSHKPSTSSTPRTRTCSRRFSNDKRNTLSLSRTSRNAHHRYTIPTPLQLKPQSLTTRYPKP